MKKILLIIFALALLLQLETMTAAAQEKTVHDKYCDYIYAYIMNRNRHIEPTTAAYIAKTIVNACEYYQVQPFLTVALFAQESNFNINAVSHTGAIGVAQIMPATGSDMGIDPYDVQQNIYGGVYYLSKQLDSFAWAGEWMTSYAIAAYNAGPGAVSSYGGVPPYEETVGHVNKISAIYNELVNGAPPELLS